MDLTRSIRDNTLAVETAKYYFENSMEKKSEQELLTKQNLAKISSFYYGVKTNDKVFRTFVKNSSVIDGIMEQKNFANDYVNLWITTDYARPIIDSANKKKQTPNWDKISYNIKKDFNEEIAAKIVLNEKVNWYLSQKDFKKATDCFVEKINKFGLDTVGIAWAYTNNMIWQLIFEHSTDKKVLNQAIEWSELIMKQNPTIASVIDTYANLLYKAGRTKEAIKWQTEAIKADENMAKAYNYKPSPEYQATLNKMRAGTPTWP